MSTAIKNEAYVVTVAVDGSPRILSRVQVPHNISRFEDVRRRYQDGAVRRVVEGVREASADSDGSDLFAGVKLAADAVGESGSIVIIDSGLPDMGVIDMTRPGMLSTDAAQLSRSLRADLAALHLKDIQVILASFGYTTGPQVQLSPAQSEAVVNLWRQLFTNAGATVIVDPSPRTEGPPGTAFTTRPVPIPRPSAAASPAR